MEGADAHADSAVPPAVGRMSPEIAGHAERLLAHAVAEGTSLPVAASRTCEQLVGCLADFVGRSGASALARRSVQDSTWSQICARLAPGHPTR